MPGTADCRSGQRNPCTLAEVVVPRLLGPTEAGHVEVALGSSRRLWRRAAAEEPRRYFFLATNLQSVLEALVITHVRGQSAVVIDAEVGALVLEPPESGVLAGIDSGSCGSISM